MYVNKEPQVKNPCGLQAAILIVCNVISRCNGAILVHYTTIVIVKEEWDIKV